MAWIGSIPGVFRNDLPTRTGSRTFRAFAAVALVLLVGAGVPGVAQEPGPEPFAALTITPYGPEIFDIGTGTTTLPEGGEVVDAATGIRLVAPRIEVQEGVRIQATDPVVSGSFGELTASSLDLDLQTRVLEAAGPITLAREGLVLEAQRATYHGGLELASFVRPTSNAPDFSAERVLLDPNTGHALLLGPYRYQDGPFTLSSDEEGAVLALLWSVVDEVGGYDASTDVPEELQDRFAPLLPTVVD